MKPKRHHNNKGYQQIKSGKVKRDLMYITKKLGVKYGKIA
jgi:hypothetical protein